MWLFKKKRVISILSQEDIVELRELQRKAYMEEAKKLVVEKGKFHAKEDYMIVDKPY